MAHSETSLPKTDRNAKRQRSFLGFTDARIVAFLLFVVFVIVAPQFMYTIFLMKVYTFIIFACGYNLLLGYTGLMSFGHAAFFGMGAYVTSWVAVNLGLPTDLSLLCGALTGVVLGLLFGALAIKRKGLYFAMITLALAQMIYFVCLQAPFTGGENGIQSVPRGTLLGVIDLSSDQTLYWVVSAIVLLVLIAVNRIVHSPYGQVLKAIREHEPRAISLGYNVSRYKLVAFALSAGLSGFAGGLKSIVFQIATLTDVSLVASNEVVLIGLVGGFGTIFGPVVGGFTILSVEHFLAPFGSFVFIAQGIVFVLFVLVFRRGIVGELQRIFKVKL